MNINIIIRSFIIGTYLMVPVLASKPSSSILTNLVAKSGANVRSLGSRFPWPLWSGSRGAEFGTQALGYSSRLSGDLSQHLADSSRFPLDPLSMGSGTSSSTGILPVSVGAGEQPLIDQKLIDQGPEQKSRLLIDSSVSPLLGKDLQQKRLMDFTQVVATGNIPEMKLTLMKYFPDYTRENIDDLISIYHFYDENLTMQIESFLAKQDKAEQDKAKLAQGVFRERARHKANTLWQNFIEQLYKFPKTAREEIIKGIKSAGVKRAVDAIFLIGGSKFIGFVTAAGGLGIFAYAESKTDHSDKSKKDHSDKSKIDQNDKFNEILVKLQKLEIAVANKKTKDGSDLSKQPVEKQMEVLQENILNDMDKPSSQRSEVVQSPQRKAEERVARFHPVDPEVMDRRRLDEHVKSLESSRSRSQRGDEHAFVW